jgi:phospholipid/cholesterol/gamma-HCH transport system substrate-binding protein
VRRRQAVPKPVAGLVVIAVVLVTTAMIYNKERIGTEAHRVFTSTDTVYADFATQPKVREFRAGSDVKLAGVKVGTVRDISSKEDGRSRVTMQLDGGTVEKLGEEPTATVRATLVLGGRYYVDLAPGGASGTFAGDTIPVQRTSLPVEVGDVLHAVGSPEAVRGIRASTRQLGATFGSPGSRDTLRGLVRRAPGTLTPAADVLAGTLGTQPETDLTHVVTGLRSTAKSLTAKKGQLDDLITSVDAGTRALAGGSKPLADAIATMPQTLITAREGLLDLQPTLDQTARTAGEFRASARALDPLTAKLDPTLVSTRRFMNDLKPLLVDAQPLLQQLAPSAAKGTTVFANLNGPVLGRINGPIIKTINSPFTGTGRYAGNGGSGNRLYEELSYLGVYGAQDFGWHDKTGAVARVGPTVGLASAGALLPGSEQLLEMLGLQQPAGPQANTRH